MATKDSGLRSILPKGKNSMGPTEKYGGHFLEKKRKNELLQWNHCMKKSALKDAVGLKHTLIAYMI